MVDTGMANRYELRAGAVTKFYISQTNYTPRPTLRAYVVAGFTGEHVFGEAGCTTPRQICRKVSWAN